MTAEERYQNMIRKLLAEKIERLYQGRSRYEPEIHLLNRQIQAAERVGDAMSLGRLHMGIGIVHAWFGRFDAAVEALERAHSIFAEAGNPGAMIVCRCNLAEMYRHAGNYEQSVEILTEALQISGKREDHEVIKQRFGNVYNNRGMALLMMEEYADAEADLRHAVELLSEQSWDNVRELLEATRGLAEIALIYGNYEEAWEYAEQAYRLARGKQTFMNLVEVYLTMAHIAKFYVDAPEPANAYYQRARSLLNAQGESAIAARVLLSEAQYQHTNGEYQECARLAQEAYKIFTKLDIADDADIAQSLMAVV